MSATPKQKAKASELKQAKASVLKKPKKFAISVEQPALTGMPIWLKAEKGSPRPAHYPYSQNPGDFGNNHIEVKFNNAALPLRPTSMRNIRCDGFVDETDLDSKFSEKAGASDSLPLHLQFAFDKPGEYSVRWSKLRICESDSIAHQKNGGTAEIVMAQSDWLTFQVSSSTEQQRNAWLQKHLAAAPADEGALLGRYLPSVLAAAPDLKLLPLLVDKIYDWGHRNGNGAVPDEGAVGYYASDALSLFHQEVVRKAIVEAFKKRGANPLLAYYVSWRAPLFKSAGPEIVSAMLPHLRSKSMTQVADALNTLHFVAHSDSFGWTKSDPIVSKADQAVLAIAPTVICSRKTHELALYLGTMSSNKLKASDLLWQIVRQADIKDVDGRWDGGQEQALICITWIANKEDLPRLGDMLIKFKPADDQRSQGVFSSLVYHFMRAYGKSAVPYYERARKESPFAEVRQACYSALKSR